MAQRVKCYLGIENWVFFPFNHNWRLYLEVFFYSKLQKEGKQNKKKNLSTFGKFSFIVLQKEGKQNLKNLSTFAYLKRYDKY